MFSQCARVRHFSYAILLSLLLVVSCAIAQEQPQVAPAPATPKPRTEAKDSKDGHSTNADTQPAYPSPDRVGKSKLEQETGIVNDRLFAVLPNYTVETAKTLPPLRVSQKFRLATASVFDWAVWPFNGALAAISQAKNDPESWGQGWGAYAKRYGASFADNSIGTMVAPLLSFPACCTKIRATTGWARDRSVIAPTIR